MKLPLRQVAKEIFGGLPQVSKNADLSSLKYPISPKGIGLRALSPMGFIDFAECDVVKLRAKTPHQEQFLREGDILIAVRGSLPKAGIIEGDQEGFLASANVSVVRPDQNVVVPHFLLGWFQNYVQSPLLSQIKRASTGQLLITTRDLSSLEIELPTLQEQERIGKKIALLIQFRRQQYAIREQAEKAYGAFLMETYQQ